MKTIRVTQEQFNKWLDGIETLYGHDMLQWPRHVRADLQRMKIIRWQMDKEKLGLPYSNTGVSEGEKTTGYPVAETDNQRREGQPK